MNKKPDCFILTSTDIIRQTINELKSFTPDIIKQHLLANDFYLNHVRLFYDYFGWSGGTLHQLAEAISKVK